MSYKTIYISSVNGSDNNTGDLGSPVKTIAKGLTLLSGASRLLLDRGSDFGGEVITLSGKNNIQIDAYGTGDKPLIGGLNTVSGWTNEGGNIWSKQDSNLPEEVTNLFIAGVRCINGRVANRTATGGGYGYIEDTGRTEADGYFDGAEIVYWPYDWSRGIARVTSYASKRFDYEQGSYYYNGRACVYWIQNHRNCLSVQNTWAYNRTTKTLYIYSTTEPSSVQVSYGTHGVYVENSKYVSIKNLEIDAACQCGIYVKDSSFVDVDSVDFYYSGIYSILAHTVKSISIKNCNGYYQNNDFILAYYCNNLIVENNIGIYCGTDQGAQRYLSNTSNGGAGVTILYCRNIIIRYNEVGFTGYSAIQLSFIEQFKIEYNYVHHFNLNKYDGGGIYVNTSQRHWLSYGLHPATRGRIGYNIVTDGNIAQNSFGIYPDNNSQEFEIDNNFATGSKYNFHLHDVGLIHVHDNIAIADAMFYNAACVANHYFSQQSTWDRNNIFENNYWISHLTDCPAQYFLYADTLPQKVMGNKYLFPNGKNVRAKTDGIMRMASTVYTLDEWKADDTRVDWDRDTEAEVLISMFDTGLIATTDWVYYVKNTTQSNIQIAASDLPYDDYILIDGSTPSFPLTIAPYTVKVFIRAPKPEFSYAKITAAKEVKIYMTLRLDATSVPATTAFTNTGNTCNNVAIASNVITLTFDNDVVNADIGYTKPASNVLKALYTAKEADAFSDTTELFSLTLTSRGDGTGISYIAFQARADVVMTLDGNGRFCNSDGSGETNTKTITAGTGTTRRDFYVKCTSGTSKMTFDNIKDVTRFTNWTFQSGSTNAPSIGGDITKANMLDMLVVAFNNSYSGSIEKTTRLTQLSITTGNTVSGNIDNHSLLEMVSGTMPISMTTARKMKRLVSFSPTGFVINATLANQILADFVYNKDEYKSTIFSTQRIINLTGATGSEAPTGQGVIDKLFLQGYRSPLNDATRNIWTVTTR